MKFRKNLALIIIFVFAISLALSAQTKKTDSKTDSKSNSAVDESKKMPDGSYRSTKYNEAERPDDSYLAKFHAIDIVEKLVKRNLEQVYLLKVITSNFKTQSGWAESYKKCYKGYKRAMELYYRRNPIYARVELEKNRKDIRDLMQKIAEVYNKQTQELLNRCADKILDLHLDERTRSDPDKMTTLMNNQMRLKISYGQLDDALGSASEHNFESSIYHLRVAKSYVIKILEDLAPPNERAAVRDKYKFHKADNLNRVFSSTNGQKTKTKTETKTKK